MKLNDNLDAARARWEAWFDGTLTKGPIVAVTAPLETPRERPLSVPEAATPHDRRTNGDYVAARGRNGVMATWYGGDAIPSVFVNLGPGSVAAYIGGKAHADERTVWFEGFDACDELEFIRDRVTYDADNPYWRATQAVTRRLLEVAGGDFWVSMADLGGELDILVSFRSNVKLLVDLVDQPALVHACEERIAGLWLRYFDELIAILRAGGQEGNTCWLPCWYGRPWSALQCDMSVMFSTAMFEEFVVPRLRRKAAAMGAAIYHWDGPGELRHVEAICSVENVRALEYVARTGGKDEPNASAYYLPWYLQAAEAGRGILIRSSEPAMALELSRKMPAERLAVILNAPTVAEAKRILGTFGDLSSA